MAAPSSSSRSNEREWLNQVVLLRQASSERIVGGGCLIGPNHVLTLRRVAQEALGDVALRSGAEIWVTPLGDEARRLTATIEEFDSGAPMLTHLALLTLHPGQVIDPIYAQFTTPLHYTGHMAETLGRDRTKVKPISCMFNETPNDIDRVWMSGMGKVLDGAPVWSEELSSFLGLAGSEQRNGEYGLFCVPGPVLSAFVPRLHVDFLIPEVHRPTINDLAADDPNVELFGRVSKRNGRRLRASIWPSKDGGFVVRMKYERMPGAAPSRGGSVTFVTYPNLDPYQQIVRVDVNGSAEAECYPLLPDFTIAAIGDGGATRLTFDLSKETLSAASAPESIKSEDEAAEGQELLEVAFRSTYAAFETDLVAFDRRSMGAPLKDTLNNGVYARHLAQLIVARKTPLPLSLGLFGDWGSGKSYFMRLLHQEIELLTVAKETQEVFCQKVVQIHFNAWHYLDTNLWANLVCEIFDNLFAALIAREDTPNEKVEALKKKLADEGALATEAKKALKEAELAREQAEKALHEAEQQREQKQKTVAAFIDDLKQVAKDNGLPEELKKVADGFGLTRLNESFAELEARALEARTLGGRFRSLGITLLSPEGLWQRLALLLAALLIPVVLAVLVPWLLGLKDIKLASLTQSIIAAATLISGLATWISTQTKRGTKILQELEGVYKKVKESREKVRAVGDGAKKQEELDRRIKAEANARHALKEAEAKVRLIESEIREMAPGRRLIKFLEQRAGANDYRQHLGLVSLVRRDFEQLSRLLQEGSMSNDPHAPKEPPLLDRIVLYIDDLDRCKPDRVVAVLEAVHLLLAFPIFAVVVAVDPRWLRRSLTEHYPTLLAGGNGRSKGTKRSVADGEILASPQDYLEKIFQVPFQLQPMEEEGFGTLVTQLLPVRERVIPEVISTPQSEESASLQLPYSIINSVQKDPKNRDQLNASDRNEVNENNAVVNQPITDLSKSNPAIAPVAPERLQLEEWEQTAVKLCHPLFRTPRAVKRLANTYCLIRAGVDTTDWKRFIGSAQSPVAEYRTPLLLLAVSSAYPSLAGRWFEKLKTSGSWMVAEESVSPVDTARLDEWKALETALKSMDAGTFAPFDRKKVEAWLPRVKRYSF